MRFVIQRVTESSVKVDGEVIGKIGKGFMVLIGVADSDTKDTADKMLKKMLGLRIFEDENGKTNLFDYFVGQVMKETKGKANPSITKEILKNKLDN